MAEATLSQETYSFSRISCFYTCPYSYYLNYCEKNKDKAGNAFASYGTEVHSIMERYAKGELPLESLADVFEWEYSSAVTEEFPKIWIPSKKKQMDLEKRYYQQAIDFLNNFEGYGDTDIIGAEIKFQLPMPGADWLFSGIIDLLYRDKDGGIVIRDYKSKAGFKSKKERMEYERQLYLYALYVKETYGVYPKTLEFLMFRNQEIIGSSFDELKFEEACEWAKNGVNEIRETFYWPAEYDKFYCENLCDFRNICPTKELNQ